MKTAERQKFADLLVGVFAAYRVEVTRVLLEVWWAALKDYDLTDVDSALLRHVKNPDSGQYPPKPADVVRMIEGTSQEAAMMAWTKVDQAVKHVGSWSTVIFDDALIHAVVDEMGGWLLLCAKPIKEWPFVQNEFVARYRAHRGRGEVPLYPPKLIGRIEAENGEQWADHNPKPVMIGDAKAALAVLEGGSTVPRLPLTKLSGLLPVKEPT